MAPALSGICNPPFTFYCCPTNNFIGCCTADPCGLSWCPDFPEPADADKPTFTCNAPDSSTVSNTSAAAASSSPPETPSSSTEPLPAATTPVLYLTTTTLPTSTTTQEVVVIFETSHVVVTPEALPPTSTTQSLTFYQPSASTTTATLSTVSTYTHTHTPSISTVTQPPNSGGGTSKFNPLKRPSWGAKHKWEITGITVGVVAGLAISACLIWLCCWWNRRRRAQIIRAGQFDDHPTMAGKDAKQAERSFRRYLAKRREFVSSEVDDEKSQDSDQPDPNGYKNNIYDYTLPQADGTPSTPIEFTPRTPNSPLSRSLSLRSSRFSPQKRSASYRSHPSIAPNKSILRSPRGSDHRSSGSGGERAHKSRNPTSVSWRDEVQIELKRISQGEPDAEELAMHQPFGLPSHVYAPMSDIVASSSRAGSQNGKRQRAKATGDEAQDSREDANPSVSQAEGKGKGKAREAIQEAEPANDKQEDSGSQGQENRNDEMPDAHSATKLIDDRTPFRTSDLSKEFWPRQQRGRRHTS